MVNMRFISFWGLLGISRYSVIPTFLASFSMVCVCVLCFGIRSALVPRRNSVGWGPTAARNAFIHTGTVSMVCGRVQSKKIIPPDKIIYEVEILF